MPTKLIHPKATEGEQIRFLMERMGVKAKEEGGNFPHSAIGVVTLLEGIPRTYSLRSMLNAICQNLNDLYRDAEDTYTEDWEDAQAMPASLVWADGEDEGWS